MSSKEWGGVVILLLLSNAITLFVTSKFLIPKVKTVDIVSILENDRRDDIKKVLEGSMSQDEFVAKHKLISNKFNEIISSQSGTVFVKQCVAGGNNEDITDLIRNAIAK